MKTRITNLLTATLWLLIIAVWLPTFWTLAQLPGTLDGHKSSALLRYVGDELDTVHYYINKNSTSDVRDCDERHNSSVALGPWLDCLDRKTLETRVGDWFIPLAVFTLVVLVGQYILTGGLTLRFAREKEDTKT